MNTNDILRRIRYTFNFNDIKMGQLFELTNTKVTLEDITGYLKKEEDQGFIELSDHSLALFLNGLIINNRGKKEGETPVAETKLNNNSIFRKLKIALNLKDEDILAILALADMRISKHELSAFFRNPKQEQYRECKDQILRNFMQGMQKKYRDTLPKVT